MQDDLPIFEIPPAEMTALLSRIVSAITRRHPDITYRVLKSRARTDRISWMRFFAMYLAFESSRARARDQRRILFRKNGAALIGRHFKRSWLDVRHAIHRVEDRMAMEPFYAQKVEKWLAFFSSSHPVKI